MIQKVFGPPGTGKTTKLLNLVDDYIAKGVPLDRIGYFAFTRKAANEARDRFLEKHPGKYKQKEVRFFQTLHSLAFHTLGMSEDNVMDSVHYELVCEEMGIHAQSLDEGYALKSDNEYFRLLNKARVKKISVEDEYNTGEWSSDIDLTTLLYIEKNFNQFKEFNHLDDYTDMLEKLVKVPNKFPQFDVVFIDEAQDLAPIQWDIFDILKEKSKHIYLAGDDDQAIYSWAGADVDRFIDQECDEEIILDQSRRVPFAIQEVSEVILDKIEGKRKLKKYRPKQEEGLVEKILDVTQVDIHQGKWLILARTGSRLKELAEVLREQGVYYQTKKGKSFKVGIYKAARNYTRNQMLTEAEMKEIKEYTGGKEPDSRPWFEAFVNAPHEEISYIKFMLSNGEKLLDDARVRLSTIHAAKGGEEDNVILILDNARKIRRAVLDNKNKRDEEHRVWYVGATRAKKNLYLHLAKTERNGYQI